MYDLICDVISCCFEDVENHKNRKYGNQKKFT